MSLPTVKQVVEDYILKHRVPAYVSLDENTHLFYFHESDWRKSPIIFVNRGGNYVRMILGADNRWYFLKTWNGLDDVPLDWMRIDCPKLPDPEKALNLISSGPGYGKKNMPSLLPREASAGRRLVVFGHRTANIKWDKSDLSKFWLMGQNNDPHSLCMRGKVWESQDAVNWFMANFTDPPKIWAPGVTVDPYVREREMETSMAALEDNPLWGAF